MNSIFVVIDFMAMPVCAFSSEEFARRVVEDAPDTFLTYVEIPLCAGIANDIRMA